MTPPPPPFGPSRRRIVNGGEYSPYDLPSNSPPLQEGEGIPIPAAIMSMFFEEMLESGVDLPFQFSIASSDDSGPGRPISGRLLAAILSGRELDDTMYEDLLELDEDKAIVPVNLDDFDVEKCTLDDNFECTICYGSFKPRESVARLRCQHDYCLCCTESFLSCKSRCPILDVCKKNALKNARSELSFLDDSKLYKMKKFANPLKELKHVRHVDYQICPFAVSLYGCYGKTAINFIHDFEKLVKRRMNKRFDRRLWLNRIVFTIFKSIPKMISKALMSVSAHYEDIAAVRFDGVEACFDDIDF
ncbi:hypothetical protein P9112_013772 [Eukaryota sp. TZLM1-RC]